MQAVMGVNAEQASKRVTCEPTRLRYGEGRCLRETLSERPGMKPTVLATVMGCFTRV